MTEKNNELEIQTGNVSYQWQVSTDNGISFADLTDAPNSSSLTLTNIGAIQHNYQYRNIAFSGGLTIISKSAKLVVLPEINIVNQPTSQTTINQSATFSFSAEITSGANSVYQWESAPFDNITQFTPIVNATGTTLTLNALQENSDGSAYRAKIISKLNYNLPLTVYTNTAYLDYIAPPITILQQPQDLFFTQALLQDSNIQPELFSVVASSNTALSYQWQESADGIDFKNLTPTNNPTLFFASVEDLLNKDQYKYRVVISSDNHTINSNICTLHTTIELPSPDSTSNNTYLWGDPHLRIQSSQGTLANVDDNINKDPIVYFYAKYDNGNSYKVVYGNRFASPASIAGPAAVNTLWLVENNTKYVGLSSGATQSKETPSADLILNDCTFAGVTGWDYALGRCLSLSTALGVKSLNNNDYAQLIRNIVKWLCKNKNNPSILIIGSMNTVQDETLKNKLAILTNKQITIVSAGSFTNNNNILETTDVVILQNRFELEPSFNLSSEVQLSLKEFVKQGGGLLTTENTIHNIAKGLLKILEEVVPVIPTSTFTTKSPTRYIKNINDTILNTGVASDFAFLADKGRGTETAITQAKSGATIFYHSEQCVDISHKFIPVGNILTLIYQQDLWNSTAYYNMYTKWNKSISYPGKLRIGGAFYWILKSLIEHKKNPSDPKYLAWKGTLTGSKIDGYSQVMKPFGITRQMLSNAVESIDGSPEINNITEEITIGDNFWKNLSKLLKGLKPDDKYHVKNVVYFIKHPGNRITTLKNSVSMDAQALSVSNSPITYKWQMSPNKGVSFINLKDDSFYSGSDTPTLHIQKPTESDSGRVFRLSAISEEASIKYSNNATLTVLPSIIVSSYPTEQIANDGTATFFVAASSTEGSLKYQWQKSNNQKTGFTNILNATSSSLTVSVNSYSQNNIYYRVILENNTQTITTNGVKLTAVPIINITTQPSDFSTNNGQAAFMVMSTISSPLITSPLVTYQWQESSNGRIYNNIANQNNNFLTLSNLTQNKNNYLYRVIIKADTIQLISNPAKLTVVPSITFFPINYNVYYTISNSQEQANVEMIILAQSTSGPIIYQWQQSKDQGKSYQNLPNTNFDQITVKDIPKNSYQLYKYRVIISNSVESIIAY